MSKHVIIRKNDKKGGILFTPNERNPEIGSIRVETPEERVIVNNYLTRRKRVAFISMSKADFEKENLKDGDTWPGTIYYTESTFPQYDGHEPKINPRTEEVITDETGQPIYFTANYSPDPEKEDEFLVAEDVEMTQAEKEETQKL